MREGNRTGKAHSVQKISFDSKAPGRNSVLGLFTKLCRVATNGVTGQVAASTQITCKPTYQEFEPESR